MALTAVAVMVCSCGQSKKAGDKNVREARLLYWNIQNGMWSDQPNNYDNFVEYVKSLDPDICVWCEASTIYLDGTATPMPMEERYLPAHWDELAARYGHKYTFIGAWNDNFPQVITSKYPVETVKLIPGDEGHVVSHGAGWAKVRLGGKDINIVTLHTWPAHYAVNLRDAEFKDKRPESIARHAGDSTRREELKYLCEQTILTSGNQDKEYWLMLGDHNSRTRKDNYHYQWPADTSEFWAQDIILQNTSLIDVIADSHPGEYQHSHANLERMDLVYASKAMFDCVKEANIIREGWPAPVQKDGYNIPLRDPACISNFWHPSDHLPILIDFKL